MRHRSKPGSRVPRRFAFLLAVLVAVAARAEMPTDLALPIDCEPGESC